MHATSPNQAVRRRLLIRARLFLAGVSQGDIARACTVTRGMVCHVVNGRRRNARIEAALADACHMSTSDLWED